MKQLLVSIVFAAACSPTIDFDLGLDPGPVVGERGAATFSFVDGCPGADPLFGCPKTLPGFAVGSQARFIIGTVSGDAGDERRLARATAKSLDRSTVAVSRDADGLLVLDSVAPGHATITLVEEGDVIDSIEVHVESIASLETNAWPPPLMLAGARFPASVDAFGPTHAQLFARGAIAVTTFDGLVLDPDTSGYFTASDQVAVKSDTPGDVKIEFWADSVSTDSRFQIVTRDEITEVVIAELFPTPGSNKVTLFADTKVNGVVVRGGPACDWRIVSGGGPGVALSSAVGDAFTSTLFVLYNSAIVYGSGETVIECRANERAVAQHTIQFAP